MKVKNHYNLYYLFLEDKEKHPMSDRGNQAIRKNVENFYKKIKPPWNSQPLISSERNKSL